VKATAMSDDDLLRFKVVGASSYDEMVARAINLLVGRAAFVTAGGFHPDGVSIGAGSLTQSART
jgi:hypothetical protein